MDEIMNFMDQCDISLDLQMLSKEICEAAFSFEIYNTICNEIKAAGGVTPSLERMFGENFSSAASMGAEATGERKAWYIRLAQYVAKLYRSIATFFRKLFSKEAEKQANKKLDEADKDIRENLNKGNSVIIKVKEFDKTKVDEVMTTLSDFFNFMSNAKAMVEDSKDGAKLLEFKKNITKLGETVIPALKATEYTDKVFESWTEANAVTRNIRAENDKFYAQAWVKNFDDMVNKIPKDEYIAQHFYIDGEDKGEFEASDFGTFIAGTLLGAKFDIDSRATKTDFQNYYSQLSDVAHKASSILLSFGAIRSNSFQYTSKMKATEGIDQSKEGFLDLFKSKKKDEKKQNSSNPKKDYAEKLEDFLDLCELIDHYNHVLDYINTALKDDPYFISEKKKLYSIKDCINYAKAALDRYKLGVSIIKTIPFEPDKYAEWGEKIKKTVLHNKPLPSLIKIEAKDMTLKQAGYLDKALLSELKTLNDEASNECSWFSTIWDEKEVEVPDDFLDGFGISDCYEEYHNYCTFDDSVQSKLTSICLYAKGKGCSVEGFLDLFKSKKKQEELEEGDGTPLEKFCLAMENYDGKIKLNLPSSGQFMTYGNFMKYATLILDVDANAQSWYLNTAWGFLDDLYKSLESKKEDVKNDGSIQLSKLIEIYKRLTPLIKTTTGKVCFLPESLNLKEDARAFENGIGSSSRFRTPSEVKKFDGMLNSTCWLLIDEDFDKRQWSRFNWAYYMKQHAPAEGLLPSERKAFDDDSMGFWDFDVCLRNLKSLDSVEEYDIFNKAILNYSRMYYLVGIMTGICKKMYNKMKPTMTMLANAVNVATPSEEQLNNNFWE